MKNLFLNSLCVCFLMTLCRVTLMAQDLKYPALSDNIVAIHGDSGQWDYNKVHTLSVVEVNKDGYKYWGYYGLSYYGGDPALRKAGLARSNDLVHWDKYKGNPIINSDCRWPNVVLDHSTFYMFYAEYNANNDSRIVMVTSEDGITFGNKVVVVPREIGKQNQNPFIYFNKQDDCFYLTYYSGIERSKDSTKNVWRIKLKKSKNISGLKGAEAKILLSSKDLIAAPSMAFYNNRYYLLIESRIVGKWDSKWVTLAYESDRIGGQYKMTTDVSPVLYNDDACAFQYVFDNMLYVFYSHCLDAEKSNWDLRVVKVIQ